MELKSVYNKIESNNKKYPEYEIKTNIANIYPNITMEFSEISEDEKINRNFGCTGIEYNNQDGRISSIMFKVIK